MPSVSTTSGGEAYSSLGAAHSLAKKQSQSVSSISAQRRSQLGASVASGKNQAVPKRRADAKLLRGGEDSATRDKVTERVLAHALKNSKVPPKLINLVKEEEFEVDVEVAFGLDGGRLNKLNAKIGPKEGSSGQLKSIDAVQTRYLGRSERDQGASGVAFAKVDKAAAEKEQRLLPHKLPSEAGSPPILEQME